ncbi:MAG: hypothetical protein ACLUIQ_04305 [Dialister invisus]
MEPGVHQYHEPGKSGFLPTASATAVGIMLVIYLTFGVVKLILRDKINIFDL